MAAKSGLQLYTYRFEGTIASPTTYHLIKHIRDESLDLDKTEVDVSSRASIFLRTFVPGLANGNVETQILHLPGDTEFDLIQQAFFQNDIVLMAFVDNPLNSGDAQHGESPPYDCLGLFGAFYVTNFSEMRALEDGHYHDVRYSPTLEPSTNAPPIYKTVNVAT